MADPTLRGTSIGFEDPPILRGIQIAVGDPPKLFGIQIASEEIPFPIGTPPGGSSKALRQPGYPECQVEMGGTCRAPRQMGL